MKYAYYSFPKSDFDGGIIENNGDILYPNDKMGKMFAKEYVL